MALIDNLRAMDRDQLVDFAMRQGIQQVHWKAKPETIIKQIIDHISQPVKQEMKHEAEKPKSPVIKNTPADVEPILEEIASKLKDPQAFTWQFDERDHTVHVRCRGAEECFNLDIPMRILKSRAQLVARGRIAPMSLNHMGFDQIQNSPNNAYTGTVLAG